MAIKLAGALLERDVKKESSKLGAQAAKLAKAKSGGAGIGGLLGAIAGVALAPFTGGASLLMAGIGGGLGALAGSKIAGAGAGGQESLYGGKFMQTTRSDMATQIAQQEGTDVLMAAGSGMLQAGNIVKGLNVFKGGAAAAKEAGKGFLGQIGQGGFDVAKGMTKDLFKGFAGKEEAVGGMAKEALQEGATTNILDIAKLTTPAKRGGIGKALGGLYGGADKMLGGILPGGTSLAEGYLGKIPGLLGSQTGQTEYASDQGPEIGQSYEMSDPNLSDEDFIAQHEANMFQDSATNPDMENRIKEYMSKGWAPDNTIDMNLWQIMGGQ